MTTEQAQDQAQVQEQQAATEAQAEESARGPAIEEIKVTVSYRKDRTVIGAQVVGCDPVLAVFTSPPPTLEEALSKLARDAVRKAVDLAGKGRRYPAHHKASPAPHQPSPAAPRPATTPQQPAAKVSKEGVQEGLL